MNILGITGFFHDPSAALLVDGKLVAFVEDELLMRDFSKILGFSFQTDHARMTPLEKTLAHVDCDSSHG